MHVFTNNMYKYLIFHRLWKVQKVKYKKIVSLINFVQFACFPPAIVINI
jgi:hypothetical protein